MKKKANDKKSKLVDLIPGAAPNSGPRQHGKSWQRGSSGGASNIGPKPFTHKATHK